MPSKPSSFNGKSRKEASDEDSSSQKPKKGPFDEEEKMALKDWCETHRADVSTRAKPSIAVKEMMQKIQRTARQIVDFRNTHWKENKKVDSPPSYILISSDSDDQAHRVHTPVRQIEKTTEEVCKATHAEANQQNLDMQKKMLELQEAMQKHMAQQKVDFEKLQADQIAVDAASVRAQMPDMLPAVLPEAPIPFTPYVARDRKDLARASLEKRRGDRKDHAIAYLENVAGDRKDLARAFLEKRRLQIKHTEDTFKLEEKKRQKILATPSASIPNITETQNGMSAVVGDVNTTSTFGLPLSSLTSTVVAAVNVPEGQPELPLNAFKPINNTFRQTLNILSRDGHIVYTQDKSGDGCSPALGVSTITVLNVDEWMKAMETSMLAHASRGIQDRSKSLHRIMNDYSFKALNKDEDYWLSHGRPSHHIMFKTFQFQRKGQGFTV